tara:strand:- start:6058 stop:6405 length:348 start_codon:yes stop_codon:yes gene_type:complete
MNNNVGIAVVLFIFLILMSPLIYTATGQGLFHTPPKPQLTLPESGKCIEPTEYMRANHMKLLMHVRDDVVREGIRKTSHTLKNCKTCHTKRAEFCDRCHDYVGAKPECFGCHYFP